MPAQRLRDYQVDSLERVLAVYREHAQSALLVMPTAAGKTSTFGELTRQLYVGGRRVLLNVHRRELATQAANRFREFGIDFGFILAGMPARPTARVQIAGVQSLVRRPKCWWPAADLLINDEAHLSTAATWQKIRDHYAHAKILGVTATPWRLSGKPLAGAYDACVVGTTPRELIERGFLSRYTGFSYKTPDLTKVKTTGGDYNEKQSAEAMRAPQIVDNIVEQWLAHASHLSTVVFAVTKEHSRELTARFRAAGVAAEHLDGDTPTVERELILKRVGSGETRVLCNVGVAVEGLDIPRLKCCVLARPTKSLARYIQMVGRVLRAWAECARGHGWAARPDETVCSRCRGEFVRVVARIHDHAFNIRLHGLPDAERDYSLDAEPELPPVLNTCSECFRTYAGTACPSCGKEGDAAVTERAELATVNDAEQFTFEAGGELPAPEEEPRPEHATEVRWEREGRVVEGKLLNTFVEQSTFGPRRFYKVAAEKRDYLFAGTTQLNALMAKVPIGGWVRVTFLGEKPLSGRRAKKLFKVEIDDER